ncbi:class I SAM-dependent methyltransferase [Thermodesulfobacteriota bacterium]
MEKNVRKAHAVLDEQSRTVKARKIHTILASATSLENVKMLEVGSGSGVIAEYFSKICSVTAVDKKDQRVTTEGYKFEEISGTTLPFLDGEFDVVVSNHVIEHVGESKDQQHHLDEIYRVLSNDGILYVAVPNKWRFVEPHYSLPFLSWLPAKISSFYLSLFKKCDFYDCIPLTRSELKRLLTTSGFSWQDKTKMAIETYISQESLSPFKLILFKMLKFVFLTVGRPFIPTIIFLGVK